MGNSVSRGTLDVIYILFPFLFSTGLIIMIVVCWWKCKLFIGRTRRRRSSSATTTKPRDFHDYNHSHHHHYDECEAGPDFAGHLINIQEYAENQVGTTIVYDYDDDDDNDGIDKSSKSKNKKKKKHSHPPRPYVYFSDGKIIRVVPLTPYMGSFQPGEQTLYNHPHPSALYNNYHNHNHRRTSNTNTNNHPLLPSNNTPSENNNTSSVEYHEPTNVSNNHSVKEISVEEEKAQGGDDSDTKEDEAGQSCGDYKPNESKPETPNVPT